jgi:hypothetical protein
MQRRWRFSRTIALIMCRRFKAAVQTKFYEALYRNDK